MSSNPDAELRKALAARIGYFRDLGIHDFYRREVAAGMTSAGPPVQDKTWSGEVIVPGALESPASQDREQSLGSIRELIGDCTRCKLHRGRKNIVFGVGNPHADLMFVGEGPGADEDEQGEPFVGRAGQLLNNMITAMGLRRKDVYIANVVKCRPPGNRQPERDECDTCSPFLLQQIDVVRPRIIVALGATAAKNLLGLNDSMANLRGRLYDFRGTRLAVTYHPAFLLRDPRQKKETWKDLQMVMQSLGLPIPAKSQQTE
jgi:uracil-DNA glycosylase